MSRMFPWERWPTILIGKFLSKFFFFLCSLILFYTPTYLCFRPGFTFVVDWALRNITFCCYWGQGRGGQKRIPVIFSTGFLSCGRVFFSPGVFGVFFNRFSSCHHHVSLIVIILFVMFPSHTTRVSSQNVVFCLKQSFPSVCPPMRRTVTQICRRCYRDCKTMQTCGSLTFHCM